MSTKYKHFISLGFFCSVALELERIGLRECSSPFDWCISDWKGVENCIRNNFEGFLDFSSLYQNSIDRSIYKNKDGIAFFHDFDKYKTLDKQLEKIKNKYERRITKFYTNISEPTLFIRYIKDREELLYLEEHYKEILNWIKEYNSYNNIFFVSNSNLTSTILKIYNVDADPNDSVARRFLDKNDDIFNFLNNVEYNNREKNLNHYNKKERKRKGLLFRLYRKILKKIHSILRQEYIHNKVYNPD